MLSRNDTRSHALIYDLVPIGLNLVLEDILKFFSVNQRWEGQSVNFWSDCAYADMNCFLSVRQRSVRRCSKNKFTSRSVGIVRGRWWWSSTEDHEHFYVHSFTGNLRDLWTPPEPLQQQEFCRLSSNNPQRTSRFGQNPEEGIEFFK